jgi:cobalt-zinc-cadmium efflux system protein
MSSPDDHADDHADCDQDSDQDSRQDQHREHDHGLGLARAGERHRGRLIAAFAIIAVFFVVQLVAAFATNSLALLSDAGHMLTDVIGIGMALAAISLATRFEQRRSTVTSPHTFGLYRLEILAAFVNSLLLFAVAVWVIVEAVRRLGSEPEVLGLPMLVVAVLGLLANLVAFALLRPGAKESVNVEGAYLEVLADTIGSVGVIVAALLLQVFGWTWVDSVAGVVIGIWILPRTWVLGRRAVRILLQSAPEHIDLDRLADELSSLEGVVGVHDLHVWTLTSEMDAASVHLVTSATADSHAVLDRARSCLADGHGIAHGTFQVEPDDHQGCDEVSW